MKTRRDLIRALGVGAAAISLSGSVSAEPPAPTSASSPPDPLIALEKAYRRAWRRYSRADDARDLARHAARERGFEIGTPEMTVGIRHCLSVPEVREAAKEAGFTQERTDELVSLFRRRVARQRRECVRAGLAPYDAEWKAANTECDRTFRAIARTPATNLDGVAVKLRFLLAEHTDGLSLGGESIARSALADVKRLAVRTST